MDNLRPSTNLNKMKKKDGNLIDNRLKEKVTAEEEKYAEYLAEFNPSSIRSPFDLLADTLGPKQKIGFSDSDDFLIRQLLILNEIDKVVKGK